MGPLGWQETVVIFVLALLLFGPKKLPELGKNLAKALGEFRRASNELKDTWNREMTAIERRSVRGACRSPTSGSRSPMGRRRRTSSGTGWT